MAQKVKEDVDRLFLFQKFKKVLFQQNFLQNFLFSALKIGYLRPLVLNFISFSQTFIW